MKRGSTLTSKGQITIPVEVRKSMSLSVGDKVEFTVKSGQVSMRVVRKENPFRQFRGALAPHTPATIAEIVREEREQRGRLP